MHERDAETHHAHGEEQAHDEDRSRSVVLGDDSLTVAQVAALARSNADLHLRVDDRAAGRMRRSVELRDELIATRRPIYGVTTGFGDSARFHLSPAKATALQQHMITGHLNGTGPDTAVDVVRAAMVIRANCLARGFSAIRQDVVELIIECLVAGVTPVIPERGTVGASGDLVPLCYLANMLRGEGAVDVGGVRMEAAEAFQRFGLRPAVFQPKEALAMINGTAFMSGFAAMAVHDAATLAMAADVCTAMTCEALQGNRGHFHPLIHGQKPHEGQLHSAARVRALLTGSALALDHAQTGGDPHAEVEELGVVALGRQVQDRYSVRCAPHVNGVLLDTLAWADDWITIEMNSSNDNPLFDPDSGEIYSGGNFYGGHVGHAMDSLKLATASMGDLLDRQMALLVDDKFNFGLPVNLAAPHPRGSEQAGLHHGFKGLQIACSSLAAEALKMTMPATAFSRSTEAHNQDKVSMGTIAARDATAVVGLVSEIAAITLLAGCQAVDLRGSGGLGNGTAAVHRLIRAHVPFMSADRRMDQDVATVVDLIRSGAVTDAIDLREGQP